MHSRYNPAATLFPIILIGLLAAMTYWLDMTSRKQDAAGNGMARHDPDYYVERFEVKHFDKDGRLQHTLQAERMTHYPDDDSTLVKVPHLTYHREPPTYVTAREALVGTKGEHVNLSGDVRVTRDGTHGNPPTLLTTERLEAFPDEEIARTDAPVQIVQGPSQVTGSGLSANNLTSHYVLEGPVHGVFFRKGKPQPPAASDTTPVPAVTAVPAAPRAVPAKPKAKPRTVAKPKPAAQPKTPSKAKSRAKP